MRLNDRLHCPLSAYIHTPLNDGLCMYAAAAEKTAAAAEKISEYGADYSNSPSHSVSSMPTVATTSGRLHCELVRFLFLQAHGENDRFFAASSS